jgi:hypothetical protein
MKRLNAAYARSDAEAIRDLVRQWERSPYATGTPAGTDHVLEAAVAEARRRLDAARDSDLARLMEQALAASFSGRDLLAELRADAEVALARARAALAAAERR